MAAFCVELRMSPGEYWNLRSDEFGALVNELNVRKKKAEATQRG